MLVVKAKMLKGQGMLEGSQHVFHQLLDCVCAVAPVVSDVTTLRTAVLQALCPWDFPRILEWVAISFSRASSQPKE